MKEHLFQRYATLKKTIKSFTDELDIINSELVKEMEANDLKKTEFAFGKFTIATKKSYKYSQKVADLEEKVKLEKVKEVERGTAKSSETHYLLFKTNEETLN